MSQTSIQQTLEFKDLVIPDHVYHGLFSVTGERKNILAGFLPIHIGAVLLFKENVSVNIHRGAYFPFKKDTCNIFININTELSEADDLGYLLYETVFSEVKDHFDLGFVFEGNNLKGATLIYVNAKGVETRYEATLKPLHNTSSIVGYSGVGESNPNFFTPSIRLAQKELA